MTICPSRFVSIEAALLLPVARMPGAETPADAAAGELSARVPAAPAVPAAVTGLRPLRQQDALLYVPGGYRPGRAGPLLVMLHGAGCSAGHSIGLVRDHAERLGLLVLAPKSQSASWDIISGRRYGPDVNTLDAALGEVFAAYSVDPERVALGGFSDGASYALSLGLINGKLFSDVFAFAPGFVAPGREQGRPRIFISHGMVDRVLPIDATSRRIVPALKRAGYQTTYQEFAGGHEFPDSIARRFFETLSTPPRP
jgi:phospholipase/carboxylesterase